MPNLDPEILIECAGDEASLEEHLGALLVTLLDLEVQVGVPVAQLRLLQRLHVEIRTLDLQQFGIFFSQNSIFPMKFCK